MELRYQSQNQTRKNVWTFWLNIVLQPLLNRNRKKSQTRKVRAKKKLIERERIEDWSDNDDYYDDVDELYDDDVDDDMEDDETMDDDVLSEKGLNDEETDSIDSWKMTEKPLDESEDFDDEYDDDELKEQEDLQEEIKQLKGRYENSAIFSGMFKLM